MRSDPVLGFRPYGIVGALIILVSEIGMFARVEPFWSWHTPIAWTGYILLVDAWVLRRRGHSWLHDAPAEFAFLACVSVPLWLIFEWYNKYFIHNWHYINLPDNPLLRYFGYAWSFGTIWPAIFETGDFVASFRRRPQGNGQRPRNLPRDAFGLRPLLFVLVGVALLVWPIVFPSPYLAAPVWLGFIFLLDPLNRWFGGEGLTWDRGIHLGLGGLICGLVWEFWNYWARTKWIYDVPILAEWKVFEMPVPGYSGFPAFALECFTMYVATRLIFWRGARRPISV